MKKRCMFDQEEEELLIFDSTSSTSLILLVYFNLFINKLNQPLPLTLINCPHQCPFLLFVSHRRRRERLACTRSTSGTWQRSMVYIRTRGERGNLPVCVWERDCWLLCWSSRLLCLHDLSWPDLKCTWLILKPGPELFTMSDNCF
jgi:hypothetical protein